MLRARMSAPSGLDIEFCMGGPFIHNLKLRIDLDKAPVTPPQTPTKSYQTSALFSNVENKYELTTSKDDVKRPGRTEVQLLPTPESNNKASHRLSLPPQPNEPDSPSAGRSSRRQASRPTSLDLIVIEAISNTSTLPLSTTLFPGPRTPIISCQPSPDPFLDQPCTPRIPGAYPISPPSKELHINPNVLPTAPEPPASTNSAARCCAITRAKQRCKRLATRDLVSLCQTLEAPVKGYCHQHTRIVLKPKGFYSRVEVDTWIKFAKWVPDYLQPATQAALRIEMEKYVSDSDEAGYIYAYEIRDPKPPNEFHIKIGRSVDPIRRLDEWDRQCGSKETAVRGWWPGVIEDGNTANSSGLLSRMIDPGEKGKYCHRLERLIHLELRDIALNSTHLTPRFQEIVLGRGGSSGKSHPPSEPRSPLKRANQPKRRKAPAQADSPLKPCPDCKKIHREIFVLERAMSGEFKGREWELVVKPIIEKWGNFVTAHASKKV